jgi:methanogenic corrinoid protein MtbC1
MDMNTPSLSAEGLSRFEALRLEAIGAVTERFFSSHGGTYAQFGQKGRDACRDDLAFHLEFLRPVLEFGLVQPMVDYVRWLKGVLATRDIPVQHLPLSLDWLSEFFAGRMVEPDAAIVGAALHHVRELLLQDDLTEPAIYGLMPEPWPESAEFEVALLAGDRRRAGLLLEQCLGKDQRLVDIEMHMIQPALYGIGRKWQNNQVSVAQEHLATAIAQSVMNQGLMQSVAPAANGKKVLLACVAGNNHAVGLQMVAVQFLGPNVPTNALLQHLDQYKPDLLGLSVSFAQQLRVVKEIMLRLSQSQGKGRPAVIVGGLAINQFSRLAGELGADCWSPDAGAAVLAASQFSSLPDAR